jgi:midasin (ATPase involved in ribosome maturation)
MLATKLRGDYRTGKRINIKKIIPYIASQYRKDKIWLRRTKPNKRNYQVMIAIDDSASMKSNGAGRLALEALTVLSRALSQLEVLFSFCFSGFRSCTTLLTHFHSVLHQVGELSVVSFGEQVRLLHSFDKVRPSLPFSNTPDLSSHPILSSLHVRALYERFWCVRGQPIPVQAGEDPLATGAFSCVAVCLCSW